MSAAALTVVASPAAQAAPQASYACSGRLIQHANGSGWEVDLIESNDGNQACVVTWNRSGAARNTGAFLDPDGSTSFYNQQWDDFGWYGSFASTGWVPEHQGDSCWLWGGNVIDVGRFNSRFCFSH
ncbi:hypothetical protein ACIBCO_40665 [Streptomyces violascens]|uniref:hypothetical protein n=1 Tax=Streptomyces violascens TaxID=67381 RepID=UPI003792380D